MGRTGEPCTELYTRIRIPKGVIRYIPFPRVVLGIFRPILRFSGSVVLGLSTALTMGHVMI
jgi:hypothetical protein